MRLMMLKMGELLSDVASVGRENNFFWGIMKLVGGKAEKMGEEKENWVIVTIYGDWFINP